MVEITNQETALKWLEQQDHQTQIWFATRCALRALPGLYNDASGDQGADLAIVLNCFRAGVIASAASTMQPFDLDVLEVRAASAIAALNALEADGTRRQDAKLASKSALNCIVSPPPARHAAEALQRCSQVVDYDQIGPVSFERATQDIEDPLNWDVLWSSGYPDSDDPFRETGILGDEWSDLRGQMGREGTNLAFWIEWYQGIMNGAPLPWALIQRIALEIKDDEWDAGPSVVAKRITEIRKEFDAAQSIGSEETASQPSEAQKEAIAKRIASNRDAIALAVASVLEQLNEYRERVRGLNGLEPDYREELLSFIDQLSVKLSELMSMLPDETDITIRETGDKAASWLSQYRALVPGIAKRYAEPENFAEATVPVGIILGCTSIGAMIGGPFGATAGGVVGGLISNQMKPGQAAKAILDSSSTSPDA
ncbi:hypothetical protein [uncultured Roseobacter sp.]|uniref:hypothetical protein n=1 Tax=uncultured Roseobacter sp. TaxID=114847 RepID=UPI002623EDD5|nr:hypothetical protein [uncultured Roseobacter sp.]